ncbi:MAG: class I SAM-dependent methyltransferase [Sulfolobales archaeon]
MSKELDLEKFYHLFPWREDPDTPSGYKRYQEVVEDMKFLVNHPWIQKILQMKKEIEIIDLCSGVGFGGAALSKLLKERGYSVNLTLLDLRLNALEKGKRFITKELGLEPEVIVADLTKKLNISKKYDIALIWGLSTPHFNPWEWIKVLINVRRLLSNDGVLAYEEADRVEHIFIRMGYQRIMPQIAEENRLVLSIHSERNYKTGDVYKLVIDLLKGDRVRIKFYYWDIASSATFAWIFFDDVDFISTKYPYQGIMIASKPRDSINLEELFTKTPTLISA